MNSRRSLLFWLAPLLFLGVFFFYPLFRIFELGFEVSVLSDPRAWQTSITALRFTLFQAVLSTLLTLLLGLPAAYLFARYHFPGKPLLKALTAVPFMLPTVVVAAGFNALLGPRGWVNLVLMRWFDLAAPPVHFLYSLWAILVAHTFYNTTIVIRVVGNALQHSNPRLEQAARVLGADRRRVWLQIILPLLRPAILAAGMLVFLFDFTSFGVILLLGGPTFATLEVEIYIQALQLLNLPVAALLSLIQITCTLFFSVLYSRYIRRAAVVSEQRPSEMNLRSPAGWRQRLFVGLMVSVLITLFVLPMASLPLRSVTRLEPERGERTGFQAGLTLDYYSELFINRRSSVFYVPPIQAAGNSLKYAGMTVLLSLVLGYPAASALARPGRLEKFLDPVLLLPLGTSAVTLGLGFIVAFNSPPLKLLKSPWLVPLAHTMIALPFVIRSLQPALIAIPDRYRQAAAVLGASPWQVWLTVEWPILRRAVLAAATFAFTVSLGEFGATSLLTRPEYPTIPIAIYRFLAQPGGMNYGQAMAMAAYLMVLTTAGILLIEWVRVPGTEEF
ncbi:MAG: iron ABC transporter permease [Anaerolineales bacterium]|nr:iron ABC transporter permease [Anaerolineales bacterium]